MEEGTSSKTFCGVASPGIVTPLYCTLHHYKLQDGTSGSVLFFIMALQGLKLLYLITDDSHGGSNLRAGILTLHPLRCYRSLPKF